MEASFVMGVWLEFAIGFVLPACVLGCCRGLHQCCSKLLDVVYGQSVSDVQHVLHACLYSALMPSSLSPTALMSGSLPAFLASSSNRAMYISMRYEDRQYCIFMSFKCCVSSLAAASLAGCTPRVHLLLSIFLRMVVMLALHLEICTAVAFLHSLLMSWIAIFAIFGLLFCIAICCVFLAALCVQRLPLRLLGHLYLAPAWASFTYVSYFWFVFYKISIRMRHIMFAIFYLRANIEF